ncbi:thioredoxin TrxC [Pseudomonas resinovorans]|uniref:Thioredoxin TrxC n=1 Tax=Metapseudomonas resinovorans TaxID=53412 RepID=A0ABT4Y724_METRE|nr:thioredoxin TrxC [Pseudomonas resinovorans]MDA8484506.1 thioredoxin TrxC [Pseudomonas resinovorans]
MTDPLLIPCAHCAGLNRIPAARLGDSPRCGHCKNAVLPAAPFDLNEADFTKQLRGDMPLLVDVWADWCGPCKSFAPIYQQAAGQLQGRCRLGKLDSEANRNLAGQLGIRSIPTLILFKDGKEVARQSGALPLPQLLSWLSSLGI